MIRLFILAAISLAATPLVARAEQKPARPNILFCIADDWGWPHAGVYGDPVVKTPAFDRIAREGVLFERAFVSSPSCTPSRNAILTGQFHWRLGPGANLWSWLDKSHPVYPLLLEQSGYHVGRWRKSWGPGKLELGGYTDSHPAGKEYRKGFAEFLDARPDGKPFCFWLGASDPHRDYDLGSGARSGIDLSKVPVPAFWPDVEQVRSDIADYYFEVQRFDADVAAAVKLLEDRGELESTIVVVTGDHGMPFPRCKANIYDMGVRVPLAIRWGRKVDPLMKHESIGRRFDGFVSLADLAPTFLAAAGIKAPEAMTGTNIAAMLPIPPDEPPAEYRRHAIFGMERHTAGRPGEAGYPCRGIRTAEFAYIRNFKPDRWPAGDPELYTDVDPAGSWGKKITKTYILEHRDEPGVRRSYELCFAKRPPEELYDMANDPHQLHNLADDPRYAEMKAKLSAALDDELKATGDPRVLGQGDDFEKHPYFGGGRYKPDFKP